MCLDQKFGRCPFVRLLESKFSEVHFELAKKDVLPFLKDPAAVEIWSRDFFISLLFRLQTVE